MRFVRSLATPAVLLAAVGLISFPGIAFGHTSGAGATPEHILVEVAEWGLAVAAVLGLIVLIFWIRVKRDRTRP